MKFVLQKGGYCVIQSYRFRAGFKVNTKSVICPVDSVGYSGYTISYNLLKYIFCEKYPAKDFNEFLTAIYGYVPEGINPFITFPGVQNLMQSVEIYDNTKYKELSLTEKDKYTKDDWNGREIFEGDVCAVKFAKDIIEYGVVAYDNGERGGSYSKGGIAAGSYAKNTKIVGNIFEGYPKEADYAVKLFLEHHGEQFRCLMS